MPNGDLLKQLFRNYKSSDNPGFEAVAQQIIAKERQKNHHVLANDLQRILANGRWQRGERATFTPCRVTRKKTPVCWRFATLINIGPI
jgi:hypothetical protein